MCNLLIVKHNTLKADVETLRRLKDIKKDLQKNNIEKNFEEGLRKQNAIKFLDECIANLTEKNKTTTREIIEIINAYSRSDNDAYAACLIDYYANGCRYAKNANIPDDTQRQGCGRLLKKIVQWNIMQLSRCDNPDMLS
jgi:hypothetical protein